VQPEVQPEVQPPVQPVQPPVQPVHEVAPLVQPPVQSATQPQVHPVQPPVQDLMQVRMQDALQLVHAPVHFSEQSQAGLLPGMPRTKQPAWPSAKAV